MRAGSNNVLRVSRCCLLVACFSTRLVVSLGGGLLVTLVGYNHYLSLRYVSLATYLNHFLPFLSYFPFSDECILSSLFSDKTPSYTICHSTRERVVLD